MYKQTRLFLTVLTLILLFTMAIAPASANDVPPMTGFTSEKASWQYNYEEALKAIPDPAVARSLSVALTDHSTLVGSDWDKWNVDYTVNYLKGLDLKPEVFTYYPYISVLNDISVEMLAPSYAKLKTKEDPLPWQNNFDTIVPAYNAYSPAGDVTGDVVYVNYGVPEDYAKLAEMGISVEGKIAIARYGISFRGVKTKVAAEHGAIGLLIYSDPADDGFVRGLTATTAFPAYPTYPYGVYPAGPWRAPDGVQRGSILYIFNYVGDPLTPGWAATEKAPRLDPSQAENLPRDVPTTAIGYGEAAKLLSQLKGAVAPAAWQGGLSNPKWAEFGITPAFTYHMGGTGEVQARFMVDVDYDIKPMWNINVLIPGKVHPEEVVVVGAHRDGWAYGTSDSTSGFIVVMEIARALKQLMNEGWQPDRSIILAGWDGEEYGLLGSTEWVEQFAQQLGKDCVGYINLDGAGGGQYFSAAAVPALDQLVYEVTQRVEEPRTSSLPTPKSVYEDWYARAGNKVPGIGRMGGGSDYQSFLQYIGVPSLSMGFGGTGGGNYHSTTDDLYYMDTWGDPGYKHYAAMARVAGIAALRLANADILPYRYSKYAGAVAGYLDQLKAKYPQYDLNFDREKAQALAWQEAALALEGKIDGILANQTIPPKLAGQVDFINEKLILQERDLTQPKGVPGRTWYKHMIYTPGLYTGYAVQYLAALEDSITAGEWAKVANYQALLHNSLVKATNTAKAAATAK